MERRFLTPEEVAEDLGITVEQSRQLIKLMRKQLESAGYLTAPDLIQKWYYLEQRASGFALRWELIQVDTTPLNEQRLLSMKDFSNYTSLGKDSAAELARVSGSVFHVGRRTLVDRAKFDRWCDQHNGIEEED